MRRSEKKWLEVQSASSMMVLPMQMATFTLEQLSIKFLKTSLSSSNRSAVMIALISPAGIVMVFQLSMR